jgi:hypothetical protein
VRYDLLLQPKEIGAPYDPAPIETLLTARGAAAAGPDGSRVWRLKHGDVEVRPLKENGVVVATELKVTLSDKTELIRELVVEGVALAGEAGVRLVDPSLAKTVSLSDEASIAEQFLRTARYAGEYMGVSTAVIASYGTEDPGMKPGTKVLLGIAAFFVVIFLLVEYVL